MVMQIKVFQMPQASESTRNCIKIGVLPPPMAIHTIQLGDEGQLATRALVERFGAEAPEELRGYLKSMEASDRHHGGSGPLRLEDAGDLANAAIESAARADSDDLVVGIALWAMRHEVTLGAVGPVVNALARRSNQTRSAQELAAV